jgi:hypothetical protein
VRGELDRLDPPEVGGVQRCAGTGRHPRRLAGDACDRVDRMAEQVAVVDARTPAEPAHRIPQLRIHERVHDDRGVAPRARDGALEIVDGLGPGMAHFLELLVGELRLQCLHEACGRFTGGVGDDVKLNGRMLRHARIVADNVPGHG